MHFLLYMCIFLFLDCFGCNCYRYYQYSSKQEATSFAKVSTELGMGSNMAAVFRTLRQNH